MDDIGNIGYILFFVFLLIVNAIASANKRKQKQRQQQQRERERQQQPEAESGERTKSLEEVMRELFGGPSKPPETPKPQPEPRIPQTQPRPTFMTNEDEEIVEELETRRRKYSNPLQEVMEVMSDPKRLAQRKADQEQLQRIFAQQEDHETQSRHYHINARQAIIYAEIIMKPRWREY